MGVVCSQNFIRMKKHSVAPEQSIGVNRTTLSGKSSTVTHGFASTGANNQSKQVFQNSTIACHTPDKSSSILVVKPSTPSSSSHQTAQSLSSHQTTSTSSQAASQSFSDQLFTHKSAGSSSIDEHSILCRSNELNKSKIFKRSLSVDSSGSPISITKNKSNNIHKIFKSNQNLCVNTVATQTMKEQTNMTKLYQKFGGSVQSLLNPNSHSNRNRKSNFSVSETNLSALKMETSKDERNRLSTVTTNSNEYCPSVLFNRISNRRRSSSEKEADKNLMFMKWKNYFLKNVLRKRKDLNSRKT